MHDENGYTPVYIYILLTLSGQVHAVDVDCDVPTQLANDIQTNL